MAFDSNIILRHDNGTSLVIQFEKTTSRDNIIELPLTDERLVTENRFAYTLEKLKEYLSNPSDDKLIVNPVINGYSHVGTDIVLNIDDFFSPVYMRPAGMLIRINNNTDFIPTPDDYQNFTTSLTTSLSGGNPLNSGLVDGQTYTLGIRFLSDGRFSNEVTTNYVYRAPITGLIRVDRVNVGNIDINTGTVNIQVISSISVSTSAQHVSTDWVIEKKVGEEYVKVWESLADTTNKESIEIGNIMFSVLSRNTTYYIKTKRNYSGDRSTQFSERYEFLTPTITLTPISKLKSYPNYIAVSNPQFEIEQGFKVSNGTSSRVLSAAEITGVTWNIFNNGLSVATETGTYTWNLSEGTLEKNKNYVVQVYYSTTLFGNSDVASFDIKTRDFDNEMDGIPSISSRYGDYCFFGEIESNQLMVDGITYRGIYSSQVQYNKLDEVNYGGELYICVKATPTGTDYSFGSHFKSIRSTEGGALYKRGLPTYKQLMDYLGFEDNLTSMDINQPGTNVLNNDNGYLKLQLPNGNIGYLTKKPLYGTFTINDLIKGNLFHPYQRTIRIGKHLYYPRLLIKEAETPYEPIMADFTNRNFKDNYKPETKVLTYNEEQIIPMLLNGRLAHYNIPSIGISNLNYEELLYHRDKTQLMKIETTSSFYNIQAIPLDNVDKTDITMRLLLERIDEDTLPMDNISSIIPGNNTKLEGGYDKFDDVAYLGYVTSDEFLNSEAIFNRIGITIGDVVNNAGWFKFYYQGLIYFFSDGINLKNVNYNTLRDNNLTHIHALITNRKGTLPDSKLGKVYHNNLLYNVSLPKVINYSKTFGSKIIDGATYDIFTVTDPNVDLKIANRCMLSSCIYSILRGKNSPTLTNGYKGSYPYHDFGTLTSGIGGLDQTENVLTGTELKDGNVITNNEANVFVMNKTHVSQPGRVVLCLTIPAILE